MTLRLATRTKHVGRAAPRNPTMTIFRKFVSIMALFALAACGGGGGGAGTSQFGGGSGGGGTGGGTGGTTGTPTLQVSLSSSNVTSAAPATVTATLRDSSGTAVANAVVGLSTVRGNLATLASSSILTNSQGVATVQLRSAASGVEGADEVVGVATVGATPVEGRAGFVVSADTPTLSITPSNAALRFSTAPLVLSARVLTATGSPVANQVVTFSAANGLVVLDVASALTNAAGDAVVSVRPLAASTSGAEIVTASTIVSGRDLQARASIQLTAEAPSVAVLSLTSSSITSTAPATLRVVARGLTGNLLAGTVVTFGSQSNLATFTPATQVTDSNGEATTVVSPRTPTSSGADTISAAITAQGITATAQRVVQFTTSAPTGTPTFELALSSTSISAAAPATVTATLRDAQGAGVPGQVVSFNVVRGLAVTNIATALTQSDPVNLGRAIVVLSPASSTSAGADEVSASVSYAGVALQRAQGFQVQATAVTLNSFVALINPLPAYGQTNLTLGITGASVTSPVNISVSSSCATQGKATLSPSSFTATSATVTMQYRDSGCGAVQATDQLQAVVTSTGTTRTLSLAIQPPAESSIAFVQALPEQIFLRGSGFTESSVVTFEVRDAAGNPLPNRVVELRLQTGAGGVTMEGRGVESVNPASPTPFTLTSNALGRISARVNSGTLPTPVRVHARLATNTAIATVSSNLSVAVGLPSQLNFSLSQGTRNIEGYNIDGTPNTYQIIAADRSGNPVPAGTSINFITEGGQVEAIKQTQLVNGIARTTANFVSSEPRPVDGRVTVTTYALGEESFLDLNGDNAFNPGEPFQDLGNIFKDRIFDGLYDAAIDEYVPLTVNNSSACVAPPNPLLLLDASIPSMTAQNTCDGVWSGAGQVYVRRATETVLSTSGARPLWPTPTDGRLLGTGALVRLQVAPNPATRLNFRQVLGDTLCSASSTGTFTILVGDANPGRPRAPFLDPLTDYDQFPRLNPMAALTTVGASSPTIGFTAIVISGSLVPSTTDVSSATISYDFASPTVNDGLVVIAFVSPVSSIRSSATVRVVRGAAAAAAGCP